jgi:uncharacterized protein YeaO (DUF488 family)
VALRIVRLGSPRARDEGVRIGTVRRPPRGVPKAEFARRDFYDVWLPELSPSEPLVKLARDDAAWRSFARRFRAELRAPERVHIVQVLARLSLEADFAIGCYCESESRCHRSILRELFQEAGARMA